MDGIVDNSVTSKRYRSACLFAASIVRDFLNFYRHIYISIWLYLVESAVNAGVDISMSPFHCCCECCNIWLIAFVTSYLACVWRHIWSTHGIISEKYVTSYLKYLGRHIWEVSDVIIWDVCDTKSEMCVTSNLRCVWRHIWDVFDVTVYVRLRRFHIRITDTTVWRQTIWWRHI